MTRLKEGRRIIPKSSTCTKCGIVWFLITLAFTLGMWIAFPIIFPAMIKKELAFGTKTDGQLSQSTFFYANPPTRNVMSFYMFNITNWDEIVYEGAKPRLVECGPYAMIEEEQKRYIKFSDDGNAMFYENYKQYYYSQNDSCPTCDYDDYFIIANPTQIGATADLQSPVFHISESFRHVIAFFLMFLGEYPFIRVRWRDLFFDGYNDGLLSAAHSDLVNDLSAIFTPGGSIVPIPVPDMKKFAFFVGYNDSRDESYWVRTGKDDGDKVGQIISWAGGKTLNHTWWPTAYANELRGSDTGSFNHPNLKKTDILPMFHSFHCRSFDKVYLDEKTVHGIPSWRFYVPYEMFDTTTGKMAGFRYQNYEKINYFPNWPKCPHQNPSKCSKELREIVDCSIGDNFCNDCCHGSFVNDTYVLPPGIYPLVCYPGKNQPTPFAVAYSAPHFLYSPQDMVDSVVGLNPDFETHVPMVYYHEPISGQTTQVDYRLQVNIPFFASDYVSTNHNMPSSVLPMFWESAHAELHDYTYKTLRLAFVFLPRMVLIMKYVGIALCLIIITLTLIVHVKRRKNRQTKVHPEEPVVAESEATLL